MLLSTSAGVKGQEMFASLLVEREVNRSQKNH